MNLLEPFVFFVSVLLCFVAAAVGSHYTEQSVDTWYPSLSKPAFTPPDWVFPVVWSVLYYLMGISLATVLTQGNKEQIALPLCLFALQLILNMAWSIVFFGQRNPTGGLITIVGLWVAVALTALNFAAITFEAGLMLLPYLLWVSFALVLNYRIVCDNSPAKTKLHTPVFPPKKTPVAH